MDTDPTAPAARSIGLARGIALVLCLSAPLPIATTGCDNDRPAGLSRRATTIKELPEPVLAAAKKAIPGVEFQDAWRNVDRESKLHSYEIRGRASNGKIREVRVAPDGHILELE